MNQVPLWVSYLQALATPAIALLAAVIAWGQWRTTQQKFVQDLFDRRFAVFMDVRKIASEVTQLDGPSDPALMNEVIARARFLFGDDVQQELKEMHDALGLSAMGNMAANNKIDQCYTRLLPIFESYMRLDQKPPRGAIQ